MAKLRSTIRAKALGVALLGLLPLLSGCPGVIELKSKLAKGGPTKSTVAPILFDDLEKGLSGSYAYANTDSAAGAKSAIAEETQVVHGGKKSVRVDYKSGSGTWGGGVGWGPPTLPAQGYFNAKGTMGIEFWAKAARGFTFQASIKEGKQNGGDEEVYLGPQVTGAGAWKKYFVPWESFTRGIYSGNQGGDDHLEIGSIGSVEFLFDAKQGDGSFYLDDIYFK